MTTLAEMTPEKRYDCVGMWATVSSEHDSAVEHYLAVIVRIYFGNPDFAHMLAPEIDEYYTARLESVTPRFDLPRAWSPCGTPQAGQWQTAKVKIIPNEHAKYDRARGIITGDAVADPDHEPRDSHDIRRFVGKWEDI